MRYGVRPEHFDVVGAALLWTLEQGLGELFTPTVRDAWAAAWDVIADAMRTGMRQAEAALEPEPALAGRPAIVSGRSTCRLDACRGAAHVGGCRHHHLGDEVVGAAPRRLEGVIPIGGEVGRERPDQRLADGVVVLGLHAVADVAGGKVADPRGERRRTTRSPRTMASSSSANFSAMTSGPSVNSASADGSAANRRR